MIKLLWDRCFTAQFLGGTTTRTLDRYTFYKDLPARRLADRVMFRPCEVIEWLRKQPRSSGTLSIGLDGCATSELPSLLTRQEGADTLSVSTRTLDRQIRDADLPFVRIGGKVMISAIDLDAWTQMLPMAYSAAIRG